MIALLIPFYAILAVSLALAQNVDPLTVDTPADVVVCEPALFRWAGGTTPYSLNIYHRDERIVQWDRYKGNSRSWLVNFAAGTELYLILFDNKGDKAQSAIFTIQPGPDTSCLDPDSTASSSSTSTIASKRPSSSSNTITTTNATTKTTSTTSATNSASTTIATTTSSTSTSDSTSQSHQTGTQTWSTSVDADSIPGNSTPPPAFPVNDDIPQTSSASAGATNPESRGSKIRPVVGGAVGGAIALVVIVCLVLICRRKMISGTMTMKRSNPSLQPFNISHEPPQYHDGFGDAYSQAGDFEMLPPYAMEERGVSHPSGLRPAPGAQQQLQARGQSKFRNFRLPLPPTVALPVHKVP